MRGGSGKRDCLLQTAVRLSSRRRQIHREVSGRVAENKPHKGRDHYLWGERGRRCLKFMSAMMSCSTAVVNKYSVHPPAPQYLSWLEVRVRIVQDLLLYRMHARRGHAVTKMRREKKSRPGADRVWRIGKGDRIARVCRETDSMTGPGTNTTERLREAEVGSIDAAATPLELSFRDPVRRARKRGRNQEQ